MSIQGLMAIEWSMMGRIYGLPEQKHHIGWQRVRYWTPALALASTAMISTISNGQKTPLEEYIPESLQTPESATIAPYQLPEFTPNQVMFSPNYDAGRKRTRIDTIVPHTTEGSGEGALAWLTDPNSKVSAHYVILKDGDVVRLVPDEDTAWHVRGHNERSLGVEFEGYWDQPLTDDQVESWSGLAGYLFERLDLSIANIRPHYELDPSRRKDPGKENFTRLIAALD